MGRRWGAWMRRWAGCDGSAGVLQPSKCGALRVFFSLTVWDAAAAGPESMISIRFPVAPPWGLATLGLGSGPVFRAYRPEAGETLASVVRAVALPEFRLPSRAKFESCSGSRFRGGDSPRAPGFGYATGRRIGNFRASFSGRGDRGGNEGGGGRVREGGCDGNEGFLGSKLADFGRAKGGR